MAHQGLAKPLVKELQPTTLLCCPLLSQGGTEIGRLALMMIISAGVAGRPSSSSMPSFTDLPHVIHTSICQFVSNEDLISAASTTRELREHILERLSVRKFSRRVPGVVTCDRIGPYIGKVVISANSYTAARLPEVMQWVGRMGALETLGIVEEVAAAIWSDPPCGDWAWLRTVTDALQGAKGRLTRLREVRLHCVFAGRLAAAPYPIDETRDGMLLKFRPPGVPPSLLGDFVSALPPSVTSLNLGSLTGVNGAGRHNLLPSECFAPILRPLEEGALPCLRNLRCVGQMDGPAFDALVSALAHGPFAQALETLVLADASFKYTGPSDLSPLIRALGHCPNLRKVVLGSGDGEARHFSAFMDLIISGTLPHIERLPLWEDLPVCFTSEEEMDGAVSKILAALQAGYCRDTMLVMLGDLPCHVALSAATLSRFLTGTMDIDLPELTHVGLTAHVEPGLVRLLHEWVVRRPGLVRLLVIFLDPVPRGSEEEAAIMDLVRHCAETHAMMELEVAWEIGGVTSSGPAKASKRSKGAKAHKGSKGSKDCCVFQRMEEALRRCRRPLPGSLLDLSFASSRWGPAGNSHADTHRLFCGCRESIRAVLNLQRLPAGSLSWSVKRCGAADVRKITSPWDAHSKWLQGGGATPQELLTDLRVSLGEGGQVECLSVTRRSNL